jgi:FRG domain
MTKAPSDIVANTWPEFLTALQQARGEIGNPEEVWYRGHSRLRYVLTPSLLRSTLGLAKEQGLFDDYARSASRLLPSRSNDWERLFDMQHYGIPTRLLDWTEVVGIAVAFALYDSREDNEDSAIFVLNPAALNRKSGQAAIKQAPAEPTFDYKAVYWHGNPFTPNYPIAFRPLLQSDRLVAQRGTFTIHGSDPRPLDEQAPDCVRRIIISPAAKPGAREFLEYAALDPSRIYPDIVGMARHLVRKHLEET